MGKPLVLVVEDMEEVQEMFERKLGDDVELLQATSQEEARQLFEDHHDAINAIVMDACVPGDSPNTMGLVRHMKARFDGPIIATSSLTVYTQKLINAGATHRAEKFDASTLLREVLGL